MITDKSIKKNKIVLVNPGLSLGATVTHGVYPNTAIMILGSILKSEGFDVVIIDGNYLTPEHAIKSILKHADGKPTVVGFSVMTVQLPWAYRVTSEIKKISQNFKIVWGGVHPTLFPEQTIEDGNIDIAVINDSAGTIAKLFSHIYAGDDMSKVAGICCLSDKKIFKTKSNDISDSFDNIPEIDFEIVNHRLYSMNNSVANEEYLRNKYSSYAVYPIITGLGCVYKCAFCINVILGRKYKFRGATDIIQRIKFLKKNYNANFIQPMDENFFINRKRIYEFVDLLEKEELNIKWRPQLRLDYFNDNYINVDFARRLERSGMVVAAMGAESGSQRILNMLEKQLQTEDILRAVEILSKTSIVPKVNFMVGLPGETEKEIKQTYDLACRIRKMNKLAYVSVTPFRLYPGSLLYEKAISDYGYKAPSSLREWVEKVTVSLASSPGYESYSGYRWIRNLRRFRAMQFYYQSIMYENTRWSKSLLYNIFIRLVFLRFKSGFFGFSFAERFIIETAKKMRRLCRRFCR